MNCDLIHLKDNYNRAVAPLAKNNATFIYVNVSVIALTLIGIAKRELTMLHSTCSLPFSDTYNLKFTADFYFRMRWYDNRLDFYNLNDAHSLNVLNKEDLENIWTPAMTFANALGPTSVIVDDKSVAVVVMEGHPVKEKYKYQRAPEGK